MIQTEYYKPRHRVRTKISQILLIDENKECGKSFQQAFKRSSMRSDTFVVRSFQEGYDYLNKQGMYISDLFMRPNLILYDVAIDGVEGLENLASLRNGDLSKTIPIIVFSSKESGVDIKLCYQHGAAGYIVKPETEQGFDEMVTSFNYYWAIVSQLA